MTRQRKIFLIGIPVVMAGRTAGVGSVADNMFGIIGALAGLVAVAGFIYMLATRKRATR
jgi:hypothetical protein